MSSISLTVTTKGPLNPGIGFPSSITNNQLVDVAVSMFEKNSTGYRVKIWGDVDATYNANIQTTQAASAYIPYANSIPVKLSTGDGIKTISMVINDATGTDSVVVSKTITLQQTAPVVTLGSASVSTVVEGGTETTTFNFSSNAIFQQYIVGIVPSTSSLYTDANVIENLHGSSNTSGKNSSGFPANVNIVVTLDAYDLHIAANGGGSTVVKVFVQDMAGNWSV